jgi:hypothetical protein
MMYHKTYLCKSTINYMCFAAYFIFCFPKILARILTLNMFGVSVT